jgi:hypothetical protein
MIQRIQSVILLIAVISSILLYFLPFFSWQSASDPATYEFNAWNTFKISGQPEVMSKNMALTVLNTMVILLTIAVIFMYKTRIKQARFCHLLILLQLGLVCLVLIQWDTMTTFIGTGYYWKVQPGGYLMMLPLILFLTARRYILKDEALVRSADRLR